MRGDRLPLTKEKRGESRVRLLDKKMDYEFKSLRELYERIKPALTSKCSELRKIGFKHIKEADIWNYLTSKKWQNSVELTLSEMVNDIFDSNGEDINNYVIEKVSKEMREPFFEE